MTVTLLAFALSDEFCRQRYAAKNSSAIFVALIRIRWMVQEKRIYDQYEKASWPVLSVTDKNF